MTQSSRELDNILSEKHDSLYNMDRIGDQQDKATLLSTDTSFFTLIQRSELLRIPNEHLAYLAKQLFGKPQRKNVCKFCPNTSSKGDLMDYVDHDEKEQKRMRNSSGLVRLYNSTDSGDDTDAEEVAAAAAEVMEEDED